MRRALVTILAALAVAAPAQAATIDVTSFEDSGNALCPSANQCTLRRAIELSKTNGGTTSTDTIVLRAGTYELGLGALTTGTTNQDVTILGAGADKTFIRSDGSSRVLEVQGESFFTLRNLALVGGNAGLSANGGNLLVSSGVVRLDHVRLTAGRGIRGGGLALDDSEAVVSHTLIDNNQATQDGGGIAAYNGSTLSVLISTVTGNGAAEGAGIAVSNQQTLSTTLVFTTVAYNTATGVSGGGIATRATATPPTAATSIIAGNRGQTVPGGPQGERNCSGGALTDGRGNVESGSDCGFTQAQSRQTPNTGLATALVNDGGMLPVLPISATSPARDLAGPCTSLDMRDVQRPFGAACDAGAYEYVEQPQPPVPTPTPPVATPTPTVTPTPTPVVNQTIVVAPGGGTVLVKPKGAKQYAPLDVTKGIPVGSTVDTRKGRVRLTSIPKPGAPAETAVFYDGLFSVTQSRGITTLTLVEPLAACPGGRASASAKKAKKRRLWGDGKGAFRTQGKYSAATVRGTRWLVEDSCAGTLTRVTRGSVTVRHGNRTIVVRAGTRYLARPRR